MDPDSYKTVILKQIKKDIPANLQKYIPSDEQLISLIQEWYVGNIEIEESVNMIEKGCMVKYNESV